MNLKNTILESMFEAAEATDSKLKKNIHNNDILLDTGLDSLGFAVLVSILEDKLNYDPFSELEEAIYPATFEEFLKICLFLKKIKSRMGNKTKSACKRNIAVNPSKVPTIQ